jgi:Spy/CpxP family protein refolding chaperone
MTMQFVKRAMILAGAIALTGGVVSDFSLAESTTQMKPSHTTMTKPAGASSIWDQLKLTEKQKNTIRGIRAARRRKINQLLNQNQQQALEKNLKSGMKLSDAINSLGLSADKKKAIVDAIRKSSQDIVNVLDSNQKKTLENYLKQQRQSNVE